MGSKAKKDRKSGEYFDGKTSPPTSVWSILFCNVCKEMYLSFVSEVQYGMNLVFPSLRLPI